MARGRANRKKWRSFAFDLLDVAMCQENESTAAAGTGAAGATPDTAMDRPRLIATAINKLWSRNEIADLWMACGVGCSEL